MSFAKLGRALDALLEPTPKPTPAPTLDARIVRLLQEASFDVNRLETVKALRRSGGQLSTEQVLIVLSTFDFDSYRLQAARELRPMVKDTNWLLVSEAFAFSSYAREATQL